MNEEHSDQLDQLLLGNPTMQAHAAIHLRVPMSGDDEVDAMIREALRMDLAGQALAFWANVKIGGWVGDLSPETAAEIARHTCIIADAVLAECDRKPEKEAP